MSNIGLQKEPKQVILLTQEVARNTQKTSQGLVLRELANYRKRRLELV